MSERISGKIITTSQNALTLENGSPVADVFTIDFKRDMATARRLAACWNACEHINDSDLATGVLSVASLKDACTDWPRDQAVASVFSSLTGKQLEASP